MDKPNKIAIRFSDNDFCNTLRPFLKLYCENLADGTFGKVEITKQHVVDLFNRSAHGLYWLCQNGMRYTNDLPDDAHIKRMDEYLKIELEHVYFDEEVDAYIERCNGWDNSEFFVLDVHLAYVYSV